MGTRDYLSRSREFSRDQIGRGAEAVHDKLSKRKWFIWTAIWWGWMWLVYLLLYVLFNVFMEGFAFSKHLDQFMMANVWSGGGWLWTWITVGLIGTAVIVFYAGEDDGVFTKVEKFVFGVSIVATIISAGVTVNVNYDNDKDAGIALSRSTVFYTPSLDNYPNSLRYLLQDAKVSDGERCDRVGSADTPSCIKKGELSLDGWDPRVGSLDGAIIAIKRRSGDTQRVSLNESTVTYLNATNDQPAGWSGVLDGSKSQSMGGVAVWTGQGKEPTQCLFEGDYAINRAFGGSRKNNLKNLVSERYPDLLWEQGDIWGYCDGSEPIVIIPVTRQAYYRERTTEVAAGIIIVRGDHGSVSLKYQPTVKAGEYPGPVYAMSLVASQREAMVWAAGRGNKNRHGFGYEPATSAVQSGNVSEYLLRNSTTGRLEWVTPLTLRNSTSERIVAYAISPADHVDDGTLNKLSVYVLNDDDPRKVNIDNLEADARNFFATNAGTFISNGGILVEFTPIDGVTWRVFGELNGQVVWRLDISGNKSVEPKLVRISDQPVSETTDNEVCGQPVDQLTQGDLAKCAKLFVDELDRTLASQGNASG